MGWFESEITLTEDPQMMGLKSSKMLSQPDGAHFSSSIWEAETIGLCEFKGIMVYMVSFRLARTK